MDILDTPIAADPPTAKIWSQYQMDIFDALRSPTGGVLPGIIIQAVAGSGKTTTIVEATKVVQGSTLFLAFNKAIAEDIRTRTFCEVKTLNALGHGIWRRERPQSTLDAKKLDGIMDRLVRSKDLDAELRSEHGYNIKRAVGLAKNCALGIGGSTDPIEIAELIDSYLDILAVELDFVADAAHQVFVASISELDTFDFDDQLYIPLMQGWEYPLYDNVFVDECQDLSPIQHRMLDVMHEQGSRIVAVGDRHQAIYGFRGALQDSMDALKKQFQMTELPLSISYRCPKRVIAEARLYCERIESSPAAAEGVVKYTADDEGDPDLFTDQMILCRNNAPLFKCILKHVRARRPCRVMSNFLDSFQSFIRKFKAEDSKQLERLLGEWRDKERSAAQSKGFAGKIAMVEDKYETAVLFCHQYRTKGEILDALRQIAQTRTGPVFATIHKAKGLEAKRVYILRPDLMPAFYARSPGQLQQESNLTYVAITRSQSELTWGERRR